VPARCGRALEPAARIGWYGETEQWLAYHTWLLEPRDEATAYVVMEETGTGLNPKKLAGSNPGHIHRGHDLWNISLKFLCETTQDWHRSPRVQGEVGSPSPFDDDRAR
jgi:hypothetical protein